MYEQKVVTYKELMEMQKKEAEEFNSLPFQIRLEKTVNKMIYIVEGRTGGSETYAKMLLSMLPSSYDEVDIADWCYRSDRNDFKTMNELMCNYNDYKWEYEKLVIPHIKKIKQYLKKLK